ncbi:MAG: hypothetical protein V4567_13025 [Pseudomonadota bacterium]
MKKVAALLMLAAGVAACSQYAPSAPAQPSSTASAGHTLASQVPSTSVATAPTQPVAFEIRDFSLDRQSQPYGGVQYRGRGTFATRDPRLAKGNFVVWVSAKQQQKSGEPWRALVLLQDGLGTIQTFDYQTKDEEKKETVRYYDWKILGYVPLMPGTLSISPDGSAPTASAEN